jgi:hypothetical protein
VSFEIERLGLRESEFLRSGKISKLRGKEKADAWPASVSPHPSAIRGVNLGPMGSGKSPSVAAILLGRRQAEEIAKTRSPPSRFLNMLNFRMTPV